LVSENACIGFNTSIFSGAMLEEFEDIKGVIQIRI
jgi:hypothetical protein